MRHAGDGQHTHAVQGTGGRMESNTHEGAQGAPQPDVNVVALDAPRPLSSGSTYPPPSNGGAVRVALTKERIRNAPDRKKQVVHIEEWGGDVLIIGMSSNARDRYEQSTLVQRGANVTQNLEGVRVRMVIETTHTLDGQKMFTMDDAAWLAEKAGSATDKIFSIGRQLSGMSQADVEEIAGNSTGARGGARS